MEPASMARSKYFSGSRTTQVLPSCSIDATAASLQNAAPSMTRRHFNKYQTHTTSSASWSAPNVLRFCGNLLVPTSFAALDAKHESALKAMLMIPMLQMCHAETALLISAQQDAKSFGGGVGGRNSSRCSCAAHTAKM